MPHFWWLDFGPAAFYQLAALFAGVRHLLRRAASNRNSSFHPPVSVLKPLRGMDPNIREAFLSQIEQAYPEFEILFGVSDENDPAAAEVRRLQREFPSHHLHLIVSKSDALNGKVGVLCDLGAQARHPIWVVNDSDIKVTPSYLASVVAPLAAPGIGVVTCPYRAKPHGLPAAWEAFGIAVDFIPSALAAPLFGVREFGFGSTLAFRAADLEQSGGFAAFADFLADDFQLAHRIASLGKLPTLSTYTVETSLGDATWRGMWLHQLRWARTIRLTKKGGYAGLPVTHAGLWIAAALLLGAWPVAAALAGLRIASALVTGGFVLRSGLAGGLCWMAPLWDFFAFAVWVGSYAGRTVRWRDRLLTIDQQGRIIEKASH